MNYCETVRAGGHHHHRPTYAPRCCDVPALQSPKNAVAPTQTLIATSSPGATLVGISFAIGVLLFRILDYDDDDDDGNNDNNNKYYRANTRVTCSA